MATGQDSRGTRALGGTLNVTSKSLLPAGSRALVDAAAAASILGMATSTFRGYVADGLVPPAAFSTGRVVLWSAGELHLWAVFGCPTAEEWRPRWKKIRQEVARG